MSLSKTLAITSQGLSHQKKKKKKEKKDWPEFLSKIQIWDVYDQDLINQLMES